MEAETLRQALVLIGSTALGIAFLAGLFFSLNPVALGAIPVALAYVTKARAQAFWYGLLFVLILMGLLWAGWLPLQLPSIPLRARRVSGGLGALLLGVPFSVAVCPVCTPALVVVQGVAASSGSMPWGAALLLAFAVGRAVPVALGAPGAWPGWNT